MTAVAEAALAPDGAVPFRDLLLDGDAMAARLEAALGRSASSAVTSCEPVRAKYQVGRSLRVLYRLQTDEREQLVALRTFRAHRVDPVYGEAAQRAVPCGDLAGVAASAELSAVFFTFPNDRKLLQLPRLAGGGRLVAYAPEKSATVRLDDGFAKAYADAEGERTARIHARLRDAAAARGLVVPRVLRYQPSRQTLVCEAVPGEAVSTLARGRLVGSLPGLGAALARLHRLTPPPGIPRFDRHDPGRLVGAAAAIATVRPDLRELCARALTVLEESRPAPAASVCLHGDVHLKNAIASASGIALVDLDQVCAGPAAADLGSLLAALRYATALDGDGDGDPAAAEAVQRGYAEVAEPPDPRVVRWHLAAALLGERALRSVSRLRPADLVRLEEMLDAAAAIAEGGEA